MPVHTSTQALAKLQVKCRSPLLITLMLCASIASASDKSNDLLDDYGQLPLVRDVSISPDGKHYSFIRRMEDGTESFVIVNEQAAKVVGAANASELKARNIRFASSDHIILTISTTAKSVYVRSDWENDIAVAYNFKTQSFAPLLGKNEELYPAQSGRSRILGINPTDNEVYMQAYVGTLTTRNPPRHLMRVSLDSGKGKVIKRGNHHTLDWFISHDGDVLAREDFDSRKNLHRIYSYTSGKPRVVYEQKTEQPEVSFAALDQTERYLIFVNNTAQGEGIFTMSLADGTVSGPQFEQRDREIARIITNANNRQFIGAAITGPLPTYGFLDARSEKLIKQVMEEFSGSSVIPWSATQDLSQVIYQVSGNDAAIAYVLHHTESDELKIIATGYPNIDQANIGQIRAITYPARDNTKIPAILTMPVGNIQPKNLPLLVLPHGGPESYDSMVFDWWAQYFARTGYLVLQPNFRGSTGYGNGFRDAGRGEWGRLMQDDVTDGVSILVEQGLADPARVCIMGASYGGYSALAGGAYTPELYRCVISVAGVSDVAEMIRSTKRNAGADHWVVDYWESLIGDSRKERDKLKAISPANHAANFQAPVLLLHGKDDTVVDFKQSRRMERALKKAGKQVELVTLDGEDHWLSRSETRLAMLKEIDRFLREHNPVDG